MNGCTGEIRQLTHRAKSSAFDAGVDYQRVDVSGGQDSSAGLCCAKLKAALDVLVRLRVRREVEQRRAPCEDR
jgi:hypothetical protein